MLQNITNYYSHLFSNKDSSLDEINFDETFKEYHTNTVTNDNLGDSVTIHEISSVLKKMKYNKSPGIDGISAEFLKVFWGKLRHFVTNAINSCFHKGKLSTSLRQCLITCLPKENKDKLLLKNWKPISLLCVVYKLASGTLAERLKPTLNTIISRSQCGFLPGRQISESTRLIYDLMHVSEIQNIPGLLMLIDFEKAFDSLSWKFLDRLLEFFGFDKNFIKWIKLFNYDIKVYVMQCGHLSEGIHIERGCRQGDPIAAYLFLIGAEILSMLLYSNNEIRGFNISGTEFKLTQFADDTTLILDGTTNSLQAALNTIEIFGNYSGLKMHMEKTKVSGEVGKGSRKKNYMLLKNWIWGKTEFTLLGLELSTNINNILEINSQK